MSEVRPGEELDGEALRRHLGWQTPIEISQFSGGHSNLTYLLRTGTREYVLRRAPLGPVPPKAHDMAREYRFLAAIHPYFPEAPRVEYLCEDTSVIGSAFFLMERRHGLILRESVPQEIAAISQYPQRVSEAFISCLVRLHAIDIVQTGLLALGKPGGFLERQIEGWAERWRQAQTDAVPAMDGVIGWLRERRPQSGAATIVHNDFKLDNVMLPAGEADRIEAVLDWEMATVGDPLADLGLALCYWTLSGPGAATVTAQPGWWPRERLIGRYAELSGRDVSNMNFYEVLGVFKLAVILQQIYFRFRRGQTADMRFEGFGEQVRALVKAAEARIFLE